MEFVEAVIQGIEDAFRGGSMIAVPVPTPANTESDTESDTEPGNELTESDSLRLVADESQEAQPEQESATPAEPVADTTPDALEETTTSDATVTPLPAVDSDEPDLNADTSGATDDEVAREEDLEQDVSDGDTETTDDIASDEEPSEDPQQTDNAPVEDADADAQDNPQTDGAQPAAEKAAA
ncbi:hypothetical protein [Mycolicibacterium litorale]|uniref:hypothetical protein n=1 Tax=Mycolicibacterium litorale TaxID=758802 RepID=UPI0039A2391A